MSLSLHLISLNKMVSTSNFRTTLRCHNLIDTRNIFVNKSIGEMIRQGHNPFPCNIMQTVRVKFRLCQVKSHVQTATESHDLNMDFYGFKKLHPTNSMQEYTLKLISGYLPLKRHLKFEADNVLKFCCLSKKPNKANHLQADNLHEMSSLIFSLFV